jgi:predicted house-cleaning noncanonical NTP pyrophosphatase (MazG superfamily)
VHEQWKKRKMFSNREQGIMSGLDPVPMVQGGYVPFPGMQVGGVVPQPQLFEEGDAEVNDALNSLANITKPDVPDMPMPKIEEKVEVKEEVTEDQEPDGYKGAVSKLKETFKEEIRSYVAQGNLDNLGDYIKNMNLTYTNELDKLKAKFGVEVEDPNDKLFDSQLIDEIMQADTIPGMKNGGVVENIATEEDLAKYGINVPIEIWQSMSKAQKETYLFAAIAEQSAKRDTAKADTSRLAQLLKERRDLAEEAASAAGSAYASTGSDLGELIGKISAAKGARASTLDRALADEIAAEREALKAGTSTSGRFNLPADTLNRMILGEEPEDMDTTGTYNKLITAFENISNNPADAAIVALVSNGALPPKGIAPLFHQTITTNTGDVTWPQFYRAALAKIPQDERTQQKLEEIVQQWRLAVGT